MIQTPFTDFDFSGESCFPTTEGGLLRIAESFETKAQILMGIHYTDESDDLPSDILFTRLRVPDNKGIIWESESRFCSDVLVEKMNDLSAPSQLFPYTDADEETKLALEGSDVLKGVRYSADDRFYRSIALQEKVVTFSFHYTTITFDLAFHTNKFVGQPQVVGQTHLFVKLRENSLFVGSNDLGALCFCTYPFIGPNTAQYNLEEECWQENPIPSPAPFRKTSARHDPNKNVVYE